MNAMHLLSSVLVSLLSRLSDLPVLGKAKVSLLAEWGR